MKTLRALVSLLAIALLVVGGTGARHWNGTTDILTSSTTFPADMANSLTLAFWFNVPAWPATDTHGNFLFDLGDQQLSGSISIWNAKVGGGPGPCTTVGLLASKTDGNGFLSGSVAWMALPSTGVMHHYVAEYVGNNQPIVYLDGVLQSTTNCSYGAPGPSPICHATPCTMYLMAGVDGSFSGSPYGFLQGSMAELAIWDGTLTANEVKSLATGIQPNAVHAEQLLFYVPLYGSDSPEPNWAGGQFPRTQMAVTGTTKANHFYISQGVR